MRRMLASLAGALILTAAPPALGAPADGDLKRIILNFGGGVGFPLGDTAKRFNIGGNVVAGIGFNFSNHVGAQFEYLYSWYALKAGELEGVSLSGTGTAQYGDLNLVVNLTGPDDKIGAYLIGGPGLYRRKVKITKAEGTATVPICDPWLFACLPAESTVSSVVGSRSTTDFGLNAGVGITFSIVGLARLYLEARYHYVWGPTFETPTGPKRADGQFLPMVLGLRF